ncbi:hypothetical protein HYQ44_006646 [Verticillium longisporum]|nr:hypothetical protein HYQ44_006646 [Verticillium longisporum]
MAVDVEELIITPFKEVVERGQDAVTNAQAAEDDDPQMATQMARAARALVKEGDRALKRLQPIWDAHVDKFGDAFKDAIRDSDDIAEKRRVLEDLLYDFEDYIELDSFDLDKFVELQAATKLFALDALNIVKRLKVEAPVPTPPTPKSPIHTFPPLPPLPPSRSGTRASSRPTTRGGAVDSPADGFQNISQFPPPPLPGSTQDEGSANGNTRHRNSSGTRQQRRTSGLQRAGTTSSRASSVQAADSQAMPLRRVDSWTTAVSTRQQNEPATQHHPPPQQAQRSPMAQVLRADGKSSGLDVLGDELDRVRIVSEPRRLSPPAPSSSPRISEWVTDQTSEPHPGVRRYIAGDRPPEHAGMAKAATRVNVEPPVIHSRTYRNGYTYGSSVDNTGYTSANSVFDPTSPSTTNRTSLFSEPNTSSAGPSPHINPNNEPRGASHGTFYSESDHMAPLMLPPLSEHDDGLMLADETRTVRSETSGTQIRTISTGARETACQIGPKSSFHQLKGFCDGAELFKKSEHARGMKQASIYGQLVAVGRCTSCEFYLVYSEMTRDLERDSRANFMKFNVVYRLRFMFKSHMTTKNLTEVRYACLFCTQAGHTVRHGDATAFVSQEQLLRHLSQHPQPLPEIPGVTVLYGKVEAGHELEEDYDLHFPDPPAPSPAPETALIMLPTATAIKSNVKRYGEVAPVAPDGTDDVLKFLIGAQIVGVEFPEEWGGKWCKGWHDGEKKAFPSKMVEIEGPKQNEVSLNANSRISVTARWKWNPKDGARTGWLPLEKGGVIQNVGWVYQDHWCWSGTNNKGKYGVFPASHVDPNSLKEGREPTRKPTSKGLFSRRRVSISTESSYSGER